MRLTFDSRVFDSSTRQVTVDGRPANLTPKAFDFLRLLLEERPRALSKEELHERLWPDTFVADTSLARLASEVRQELGDDARAPRWVRTVHGFGYSFAGQVEETEEAEADGPAGARCWLVWGRGALPLRLGENILGRSVEPLLRIDSSQVSRRHARVVIDENGARIEDLGSKNGTFLDGRPLEGPAALEDGDEVALGSVLLVFRRSELWGSTETVLEPRETP